MQPPDAAQRYALAWRELCGLASLDQPSFARADRVWRVVLQPAFDADVAITLVDVDAGGWLEVRVLAAPARAWAMNRAGYAVAVPPGAPPSPSVSEAVVSAATLSALGEQMPRLPLHDAGRAGRDGIRVDYEALDAGVLHRFAAQNPTRAGEPLHHDFATLLCRLAVGAIADPATLAAVHALARYLP